MPLKLSGYTTTKNTLEWLGLDFQQRTGLVLAMDLPPDPVKLDDADMAIELFYLARALLDNIASHRQVREIRISLKTDQEALTLEIWDNGQGNDPTAAQHRDYGLGLIGVRERVRLWGGEFHNQDSARQGSRICVRFPCPQSDTSFSRQLAGAHWQVLVAAEHGIVRAGLRQILAASKHRLNISDAQTPQEVADAAWERDWEAMLLDISTHSEQKLELLWKLRRERPQLRVLVLNVRNDEHSMQALRTGVQGYVNWEEVDTHLISALERLVRGERFISPEMTARLCNSDDTSQVPHQRLSSREYQILCRLAQGQKRVEIARAMNLSPNTVSTYKARLMVKMGWKSHADLFAYARSNDLS